MTEYKISARAYTKMILHAAKYPHCAVNGILLSSNAGKDKTVQIIDAVPLFHQCLHVSPMAEIALIQVEAMANKTGLQVAGYYAACELFNDNTIDKAPGAKIADKIAENIPNGGNACFAVLDNATLTAKEFGPALHLWQSIENRWTPANFSMEQCDETLDAVNLLVQRGAMKDVTDFDNHLDNVKLDWANEHLNRDIEQLLAMY